MDIFRGMTILLMVIVNSPGAGAEPFGALLHADWHGFTLTDLVFPSFLFAVGSAIPFAARRLEGLSLTQKLGKIYIRAGILFFIGYLLNWYTSMHWTDNGIGFTAITTLRVLGVLQRIALCYAIAATINLFAGGRQLLLISLLILLGYWALLYIGGDSAAPYSVEGNLVRKIDLKLIGPARLYREHGLVFDPEGLLSTLPATVNLMLGIYLTQFIREKGISRTTLLQLFVAAAVLVLLALFWSLVFPLNKKLWTSSFVLLTAGIDGMLMAVLLFFYERKGFSLGKSFFSIPGRNPLAIYIFSNLLIILFIWPVGGMDAYSFVGIKVFQRLMPGPWGSLACAVTVAMICWSVGWLLHKKKIYISA